MIERLRKQSTPSPLFSFPSCIGSYAIEGKYSEGGMSILYIGSHSTTRNPVIIKTLKSPLQTNQEAVERFNNEAHILRLLDHPNIVTLYAHDYWRQGPYIVLEFIQGRSLCNLIEHNPISLRRAIELLLEIAYALCHIHTLGIIHRDLKPENILVNEQGIVKLIDLGVAQILSERRAQEALQIVGTPIYMSPEQHTDPHSVSYPSDIYSLGIIAYELVLGRFSHGQIHLALMPKGLHKILAKALQKNVEDRYQDVVDFITDLSLYLNSSDVETERRSIDQVSKLSEHLQQAQIQLLPNKVPLWSEIAIGISAYRGENIEGIYYDFFSLPEKRYGAVFMEPKASGIEGVVCSAVLRGMWRTLYRLTAKPVSLITFLNDLVVREAVGGILSLSYVVFSPKESSMQIISCGFPNLWIGGNRGERLSFQNPEIGSKLCSTFIQSVHNWKKGNTLYIHSHRLASSDKDTVFLESEFCKILKNVSSLPAQKQAESIVRRACSKEHLKVQKHSITLLVLQQSV